MSNADDQPPMAMEPFPSLDPGRYQREGLLDLGLTHREEHFVQEWYKTGNKGNAYMTAFETNNKKTARERGSRLSQKPRVRMRFQQLLHYVSEITGTTGVVVDKMFKDAYEVARAEGQPAAMVSAARGLAKLHGLNAPDKLAIIKDGEEQFESRYMKKLYSAVDGMPDREPVIIDHEEILDNEKD